MAMDIHRIHIPHHRTTLHQMRPILPGHFSLRRLKLRRQHPMDVRIPFNLSTEADMVIYSPMRCSYLHKTRLDGSERKLLLILW